MLGEMSGTQKSEAMDFDGDSSVYEDGTGVPANSMGTMKQTVTNAPESTLGFHRDFGSKVSTVKPSPSLIMDGSKIYLGQKPWLATGTIFID